MKKTTRLKQLLKAKPLLQAPGAFDVLSARIIEMAGFQTVYMTGYGFPHYRGGPMFYADTVGLYNVVRRIKEFAWTPAPLLARLADEGKTFNRP